MAFQLERLSSFNASKVLEIEIGAEKAQPAWKGLDEYTRDLCRNPLMLTLLADELRASDNPPQNRAQLFDRFIDRYLSEWARVKGAGSVRVEKEILSALAWRLGTSRTLLSADEAAAVMSTRLAELQGKNEAPAHLNVADLSREFLHHGLLRESAGQTGFFHQAVQEYFFAREVALHQSIDYVLKHASDPEWAEVLVFVCGLVEDATEVVREVMKTDLYLAARCTTYSKSIDSVLVDNLIVILIRNVESKFDADIWFGHFYNEMLAILSIKTKSNTKNLQAFFEIAYADPSKAYTHLSRLLIGVRDLEDAIFFLKPLIEKYPNDVHFRSRLAIAYRLAGKFDESILCLKEIQETECKNPWILGNLGRTHKEMKNYELADFCLRKAVALDHNHSWAHNHLGLTLLEMGKHDEAFEQFNLAISIDRAYGWPHIGLAEIYLQYLHDPESAIKEFEIALQYEVRPYRLGRPLAGLAQALEAAGRTAEARQRYQEYLDRFPWSEHAQEALAALERLGGG